MLSGLNEPELSELVGENVPQLEFQPSHDCFQLVEGDVVFPSLDTVQCSVRNSHFPGEISIRKVASRLS